MPEDSITVTVSGKENVDWIRDRVRESDFLTESAWVTDSIAQAREDQQSLEQWLRETVGPRLDQYHADPSIGIPIEQVEQHLAARRKQRAEAAR